MYKRNITFVFSMFFIILINSYALEYTPITFELRVDAAGITRQNTIASFDVSEYSALLTGSQIEVRTADGQLCLSQIDICSSTGVSTLYWRVDGHMNENDSRNFVVEIINASAATVAPIMNIERDRLGNILLKKQNVNVLRYNTAPPSLHSGIDPAFSRNGFIHPAWSPSGNILTYINPAGHWHHYGIWNPWTSIEYDGKHYDLWNIGDKTGTVRFDSLYRTTYGNIYADILVRHRHIIFEPQAEQVTNHVWGIIRFTPKHEKIIMDELQSIRVWNIEEGTFLWDLNFSLFPCTDFPVILKEYRYAGLGWRATADWTRHNSQIVTSEGKTRQEIDGTKARWIYATGTSTNGKSGMLIMMSPQNHNFPEPLRIWDESSNSGRGDIFINIAPTKFEEWILKPEQRYDFRYRFFVFDGDITPAKAEAIWNDYANPVRVSVIR